MLRFPLKSRDQWLTHEMNSGLRDMLTDAQWRQVVRSAKPAHNHVIPTDSAAYQYLTCALNDSGGAFDLLGPAGFVFEDLKKIKIAQMSDTINYLDSERQTYTAKMDVMGRVFASTDDCGTAMIDMTIGWALVRSITSEMERRLAGTYEIIPSEWGEKVEKELEQMRREINRTHVKRNSRITMPKDLLTLFDAEKDAYELTYLKQYVAENNIPKHTLVVMKKVKTNLFKIIDRYPLIFGKFSDCPTKSLNFPLVIRLIRDGDSKFLFAEDVEKAVRWTLRIRKKNGVKVELKNNSSAGRHKCIPYSEYMQILNKFGLETNEITLVNVQVHRTRICPIPIESPTGSACIQAADALLRLTRYVTYDMQVSHRLEPQDISKAIHALKQTATELVDGYMEHHFIDSIVVERFRVSLVAQMKEIMGPSQERVQPIEISEETFPHITSERLKEELVKWKLHTTFPDILNVADMVSSKYDGLAPFEIYSRLDLCMAVRDSVFHCIFSGEMGTFLHNQGFCKKFHQFPCICREREVEVWQHEQVEEVTMQDADEFSLKFDLIKEANEVSASLVEKTSGQKIVTSLAAAFIIIDRLFDCVQPENRALVQVDVFPQLPSRTKRQALFFMTMEEVNTLSDDAVQKMKKKNEVSLRTNAIPILGLTKRDNIDSICVLPDLLDCYVYAIDSMHCLTAIHEHFPNRTVFLEVRNSFNSTTGKFELTTKTRDMLEVVRAMLEQNREVVSDDHWATFRRFVSWTQHLGAASLPLDQLFEKLKTLPIDLGKLRFVPEPDLVFNDFTRKVSRIMEESLKIEAQKVKKTSIDTRVKKLEEELPKITAHNKELEHEKEALKNASSIKDELISKLQKELKDQKSQLAQERGKRSENEKNLEREKETSETNKKLVKQLKTQYEDLNRRYKTLTENVNSQKREFEELKKLEKVHSREVDDLKKREKAQMHKIQKEHQVQIQKMKDHQGHQQEKLQLLESSQRSKTNEVLEAQKLVEEMETKCRTQTKELEELKKRDVRLESCQKDNEELRKRVSQLELLLAAQKTPEVECGICLGELTGEPVSCDVCSTQWHPKCIEQWLQRTATCPVCRRNFPSPTNFPPLN